MSVRWPRRLQRKAQAEGWDIFQTDDYDHPPFELCRLDDPGAVEGLGLDEPVFADDNAAWDHVLLQADAGRHLHVTALRFLKERSPAEYEAIMRHKEKHTPEDDDTELLVSVTLGYVVGLSLTQRHWDSLTAERQREILVENVRARIEAADGVETVDIDHYEAILEERLGQPSRERLKLEAFVGWQA